MGKVFNEYKAINGRIPFSASNICLSLTGYAKSYIRGNRNVISDVDRNVRDAVIVDAINYIGSRACCDFALYTKDLYDGKRIEDYVDDQALLTICQNHLAYYLFNQDFVKSVITNRHMNDVDKDFDYEDGIKVIVDFINYIARVNEYDKVFTAKELHDKYLEIKHDIDMLKLKEFLEKTSEYSKKLSNGETVTAIFDTLKRMNDLKFISEDGKYYYTDGIASRTGRDEMYSWDKKKIEDEIYALAYANAKTLNQDSDIDIIKKKTMEMKLR